ncbi:TBC1 domain family member 13, partial [Cucurbita argyrosperma subsp. argyrosperma]
NFVLNSFATSKMVKKRVPDWLNSSLWSSTPSVDDDRLHRYNSEPAATTSSPEPFVEPPVPIPPPSVSTAIRTESPKSDTRESRANNNVSNDDNGTPSGPSAEDVSRQAQLLVELSKKVINLRELRKIASQGIPDGAGIRSTVWKAYRGFWPSELAKKRSQYKHFKEELLMNPSEISRRLEKAKSYEHDETNKGPLSRSEISQEEHPLSLGKTSIWNQYFQDSEIIEQIDRDVKRTHPDMHFFSGDSSLAKSNQEALRNILIVFAKLNPGIRYVQGMNELLAPLFYVFRSDPDEDNAASAEADTFFCFVELLSGFRDHFCQQLDNSVVGIRSTISKLSELLKEHDEELWRHLEITTKVGFNFT